MAETASVDGAAATPERADDLTVLVQDLHVIYRVYEDRRTNLRELVSNRFRRPAHREVHAVQGVSFAAHRGEAIGFIGRNGSGKSTLMQAVAGLLPPARGEVYASSQPSLLGVSAALNKGISGRRNILHGGLALGLTRDEVEQRMDDIIEWTGLEEFIDLPLRTYSSGMRARLHFAIATAVKPEILLIDEALNVGDEIFKQRSQERIEGLLEDAGTVFVVSHSMGTVQDLCTRAIWMDQGRIVQDGDVDEVVDAYRERFKREKKKRKKRRRQQQLAREQAAEAPGSGDADGSAGGQSDASGQTSG